MTRTIISLTTIPSRLPDIGPTLGSLLAQSLRPDAVELWIPNTYKRFDADFSIPELPEEISLCRCDDDLGPATKVLPAVRKYAGRDVRIVYCDDDMIYRPTWLKSLVSASNERPDHCIVEAGLPIARLAGGTWENARHPKPERLRKDAAYRAKRIGSLGRWKPAGRLGGGYVDVAEGFGGVLIRPEFLPAAAFDIPEQHRLVDDIWLSGHMAVQGVPIWFNRLDTQEARFNVTKLAERDGLKDIADPRAARHVLNKACAEYFRATYGIWGGPNGAAA